MNSESTEMSCPPRTIGAAASGRGVSRAESHPDASSATASTPNAERSILPGLSRMGQLDLPLVMINRDPANSEQ